ncbi:MAG: response regulator [Bryobacteraceae bacterium]
MTNEALSAILDHLCNEARNSAHATFGVLELIRDIAPDSVRQSCVAVGTASADQLLRSIDDVRDLVSSAPLLPASIEEFDLPLCAGEIVEVLHLASRKRAKHMYLDVPSTPLMLRQDRNAVEQVLSRVLDTAFKLAGTNEVKVSIGANGDDRMLMTIAARDADLAGRMALWLNANPDQALMKDPEEVPFELAVMVAGKRLRAIGGSAEMMRDAAGHCAVALHLPPHARVKDQEGSGEDVQPDALNILVAEDCDDSFALSELMLQSEHVWRARDGREAIRMIQKQRFDVVFMDVHMPGMDGYSVIRSVRDWETETGSARTPLVVLSSDDLETQRRFAAKSGCSGFLRKPLPRHDLATLLDRLKQARMLAA